MTILASVLATLLICGLFLPASGEEVGKNERIIAAKKSIVGKWTLIKGPNEEIHKIERVWDISEDNKIKDSGYPDINPIFHLAETEGDEIWIMLQNSPDGGSPMIMRVRLEGDSLYLDYVGGLEGGKIAAHPKGGLVFKKR